MKCPFCDSKKAKCYDTRPVADDTFRRRRYKCQDCGKRFKTSEHIMKECKA